MSDVKLFILVRKDLKMSCGKIAVQVAHASVMAALSSQGTREFAEWLEGGQKKIVAKVQGLDELRSIEEEARKRGIQVHEVVDMGLTEVPPGSVTCAALGPALSSSLDPITGKLKLLRPWRIDIGVGTVRNKAHTPRRDRWGGNWAPGFLR